MSQMAPKQSLIDNETLSFLENQRKEDDNLVSSIAIDNKHGEFQFTHAQHRNAFRIDEIYRAEAAESLATVLEKIHQEEAMSLKKQQVEENESRVAAAQDEKTLASLLREIKSVQQATEANKAGEAKAKRFKTL
ncbi:UNVERIFIED_CONTAM: hypothetical protein HDU68_009109 [Siphonaria sp. JEL0065]|nr:hypothetical protein HDU68_009109 [Siphonaria sp. JEL0065]